MGSINRRTAIHAGLGIKGETLFGNNLKQKELGAWLKW
jgi:hypothetical protein